MNVTFAYPVRFHRAKEGGWLISSRDLPEVVTQAGEDEDRFDVAEGALQAAFEYRILKKEELPRPSKPRKGEELVDLPVETAAKAALHMVVLAEGSSKAEIAKRLSIDEKEARRLMDPQHSTKVPRVAEALAAYGTRLRISVVPATSAASRRGGVLTAAKSVRRVEARIGNGGRRSAKK